MAELRALTWSWRSEVTPPPAPGALVFVDGRWPEQYLVAELDGHVIGFIRQVPPTSLPSNRHVRQIQGLAVHPAAQGSGFGRALVEAACAAAREEGARRMTLRVLGHNTPARRLYERCGFVVEGVCPEEFFVGGRYADDVLMGRRLVGPDGSLGAA
ncbi:ribosomal protein S18 acetylase RimI-like enzyme [Kitasatospora viridis]|uniref:Ribosomal protein S18 acetylase RimI-like enzyme n=1 Tax=Kitasatospora viridis TaxID=281105 RepID=A0A561ULR0_9ACTN|nr:GNAT family N-acetyltransferase [Kitasatospora viridis]TWG00302.1 ribosomal protein S18 acetylase RimI-like enzyme [Kitasatospora viridis]